MAQLFGVQAPIRLLFRERKDIPRPRGRSNGLCQERAGAESGAAGRRRPASAQHQRSDRLLHRGHRWGHWPVEDFIIDDQSWAIRYMEVDTVNWWPGKEVVITPEWITRVSWAQSKVYVSLARETIKNAPDMIQPR